MTVAPTIQLDHRKSSRRSRPEVTGLTPREVKWSNSVRDLHRMMEIARTMYVNQCHYDEPLLRVAVEVVTCSAWSEVLQWDCNWFANKKQHDFFDRLVKSMLDKVLNGPGASPTDFQANDSRKQVAELRADADQQRAALEGQLALANYELERLRKRVGELEENVTKSNAECRRLRASGKDEKDSGKDQFAGRLRELEEELRRAKEFCLAAEQNAAQQGKRLEEAQKSMAKLKEEKEHLKGQLQNVSLGARPALSESKDAETRIAGLNEELKRVRAEYDKLKREYELCEKQRASLANAAATDAVAQDTDIARPSSDHAVPRRGAEATTSRGVQADLASHGPDTTDLQNLQEENTKLKLALAELQQKIKSMMKKAAQEGLQDQFAQIALEAGLGAIMNSEGVFERLYLDAFERIERLEALRQKHRSLHKVDILEGANLVDAITSASPTLGVPNVGRGRKPVTVEVGHKSRGVITSHTDPADSSHYSGYISEAVLLHGEPQLDGSKRHRATVRGGLLGRSCRNKTQTGLQTSVSLPQLASATMGAEARPSGHKRSAWRSRSTS